MTSGLLGLLLAASFASAADRCSTVESIWDFREISDPQIHPKGKTAVSVVSWNDPMTDASYSNLWEVPLTGGAPRALTQGKARHNSPRWSPDGQSLAYLAAGKLIVRNYATGAERVVAEGASSPVWSPDGKWLAYFRFVPAKPAWAPEMPAKPAGAKWAADAKVATELRWTFDGQGLAQPGEPRLFVAPAAGGVARQVTHGDLHHASYLHEPQVAWSSDSATLYTPMAAGPDGGWRNYWGGDIYAFSRDGGEPRRITSTSGTEASLALSPDGRHGAYTGFAFKNQGYHVSGLHLLSLGDGRIKALTADLDRDVVNPVWSADSNSIYFTSEDRGDTHLFRARLQGGVERLTQGHLRLSGLSVNAAGDAVALLSTATNPTRLVKFRLDAAQTLTPVFDPNASLRCQYSDIEELWYTSFDGKKIQGWLIKPPDFDASRKYPVLVSIHGGPHSMYGVNFQHEMRIQAGAGFVILYTNPRGSTGYGEAFGNIIQYKWPGDDIRDILAGLDEVAKRHYVDADRAVVFGGSGGGLMTSWMVTQTDRFKAAVALYPVTNWFSHIGSDDNGMFVGSLYRRGWQWEQPMDYIERSPIFHVRNVRTPTMIITGEEDWRTPIGQSEEFFRALKIRGVDTVFVRVPGEAHGIRKHPSHRIAVLVHANAWLTKYSREGAAK